METKKPKLSKWFIVYLIVICSVVFIVQFKPTGSTGKNLLAITLSLIACALILWIFFRIGFLTWAEKWIKSSYDDFLKGVEKDRQKKSQPPSA
jgi:glucan phosphoethanolaminetransferase (alkaline phosphatase superfamily)